MRLRIIQVITIVISFIVGGVFTYVVLTDPFELGYTNKLLANNSNGGNVTSCGYTKCTNKVTINEKGISDAVDKVYDAVVMIQNYQNGKMASTGTGFVYKTDDKIGYIMTNQHVVQGASKIIVILSNEEKIEAEVLGGDAYLDLAVISIPVDKVIRVAEIGNSEDSKLGDTVFTIGSPLGYEYFGTVTGGRLSGKDRMVSVSTSGNGSNDWMMKVLQTDAAINPGNSGGPLLNVNGEVIGINSLKLVQEEVEGMGFAIPIEYAMTHIESLEKGKEIERPMLGIEMFDVTDTANLYRSGIELSNKVTEGVVVANVVENTGASKSDLKKGDVIIKLGDDEVKNMAYLRYSLYKYNIGDTIKVTYIRGNKEATTEIKLTKNTN